MSPVGDNSQYLLGAGAAALPRIALDRTRDDARTGGVVDDLLAYIVAVLDRTTMGVSGLDATQRFGAAPGILSALVVLQVVVYAGAQIPAGVLLDRLDRRR